MIRFQHVVKRFRRNAVLKGIDLEITRGQRVALVGSNGAGKTTLIRCLLGEYNCDGEVSIDGRNPRQFRREVLAKIGFVPQLPPPLRMPVGQLIHFAASLCDSDPARIEEVAGLLGFDAQGFRGQPFVKLSGGQKQKLLIAIALGRDAELLVMDEPAANLDPEARHILFRLLAEKQEDAAMLISSRRLDEVAARLDWSGKRGKKGEDAGRKRRGVGMACLLHVGGGAKIYKSDGCGTLIKMDDQGYVDVFSGSMDIGQGLDTVLRQIVAETLGIGTDRVNVIVGDTDVCPWDVGVHASRSTFIAGNAALGAARMIRDQILAFAEKLTEAPREILELRDGQVVCNEYPSKNVPRAKRLYKAHFAKSGNTMFMAAHFYEPDTQLLAGDFKGNYSCTYTWGCHGVEVEVDAETGQVEILRYVAAHDVGRAINPLLLKGQVYGAVLMGVGYALTEEMIFEQGRLRNANFRDYKILTAKDAVPVETVIVETDDPAGPFGAKGIGEPGLVPTAPAIANAIYDAVGVRINTLPMKPEVVLRALLDREGEKASG